MTKEKEFPKLFYYHSPDNGHKKSRYSSVIHGQMS